MFLKLSGWTLYDASTAFAQISISLLPSLTGRSILHNVQLQYRPSLAFLSSAFKSAVYQVLPWLFVMSTRMIFRPPPDQAYPAKTFWSRYNYNISVVKISEILKTILYPSHLSFHLPL